MFESCIVKDIVYWVPSRFVVENVVSCVQLSSKQLTDSDRLEEKSTCGNGKGERIIPRNHLHTTNAASSRDNISDEGIPLAIFRQTDLHVD